MLRITQGLLVGSLLGCFTASGIEVRTSSFIASPDFFNGFEEIGTSQYPILSYTEGGISVGYVGTLLPQARLVDPSLQIAGIWTTWTEQIGGEGDYGWYGPGEGYTVIKLASGANISAIQFLGGSGWGLATTYMQYQLFDDGVEVSAGTFEVASGNHSTGAWALGEQNTNGSMLYFGFAGGGFDEVRIQNQGSLEIPFDQQAFDANAIDHISVVVPEGSTTLPQLLIAFASLLITRRKRRIALAVRTPRAHHLQA